MNDEMTPQRIRELLQQDGMTQADVARYFGRTRSAVNHALARAGMDVRTPRQKAQEAFPWTISRKRSGRYLEKRLRDHLDFYATGGGGMTDDRLHKLLLFYRQLLDQNCVVEYRPEGFDRVPREERDGELIIRLNEFCKELTDVQRSAWRFPQELPNVRK